MERVATPRSLWGAVRDVGRAVWNAALRHDSSYAPRAFGFMRSPAGEWVDHDTILTIGAVNACVRVVAETIGVLDWHLFQVDPQSRQRTRRRDLMLDRLLSLQPNEEMTAKTFKETLVGHAMLYGNGYAEIVKDDSGRVHELWPLRPDRTEPKRARGGEDLTDGTVAEMGQLIYEVRVVGEVFYLPASRVFHLKGLGFDGMRGYDVVSYMIQSAGHAIAVEKFASTFFGNGSHASGALVYKGSSAMSEEAKKQLRSDIESVHRGAANAHKLFLLEGDFEFKNLTVTPEQAQMIDTRKFSVEEVARWLRVPLHKIGHLERAHFNNVEQLGIQFVTDTILPFAVALEQEANIKLLGSQLRSSHHTKLNLSSLTRGDLNSRMMAYRIGREIGMWSPNDLREKEGEDPISAEQGGDTYIVPLNYQEARGMLKDTENKESGVGEEPRSMESSVPAAALRAACDDVIARERNYVGRKVGKDEPLAEIVENQRQYAARTIAPIVSDIFRFLKREPGEEGPAVDRICEDYAFAVSRRWANYREKPDLSTESASLEYDVKRVIGGYL